MSAKPQAEHQLEDKLHPDLTRALLELTSRPGQWPEVQLYLAHQVRSFSAAESVKRVLEFSKVPVSPEIASALAQTDLFWRNLEAEFGMLTSTQVSERLGSKSQRSYASELRKTGRIIAVERTNKLLYPGFQFDGAVVRPVIKQLMEIAARHSVTEKDVIYWLCTPTTYFRDAGRPVDHLDDQNAVVEAAENSWGVMW